MREVGLLFLSPVDNVMLLATVYRVVAVRMRASYESLGDATAQGSCRPGSAGDDRTGGDLWLSHRGATRGARWSRVHREHGVPRPDAAGARWIAGDPDGALTGRSPETVLSIDDGWRATLPP